MRITHVDPRRRSRQQHAAADQHDPRAGRRRRRCTRTCRRCSTPEGDKLSKRHGARRRAAVSRRRLPAGRGGQLPGAARLGARRRRSLQPRRSSSAGSTSPGCHSVAGALRSGKARMGQPRAHQAHAGRGARRAARCRSCERAGARRRRGPAIRPRSRCCCATARRRWSAMADAAHYFYATVAARRPTLLAEHVNDRTLPALRESARRVPARSTWTARDDRRSRSRRPPPGMGSSPRR